MADTPLRFDIYKGDDLDRSVTLEETPIKIGKLPSSHLRIEDPDVSRIHAVIEPARDGGYHIIDLGSSSGTFVNGTKVNKQKLSSGDEIKLGATRIVVTVEAAAEAADATQVAPMEDIQQQAGHPGAQTDTQGDAEVYAGGGIPGAGAPAPTPAPAQQATPFAMPQAPTPQQAGATPFGMPQAQGGQQPAASPFGMPQPQAQQQMPSSPFGLPQPAAAQQPPQAAAQQPARKKKRRRPKDHFERRFLSERYKGGRGALEVALLWKGNLFHIDQYEQNEIEVSVGASPDATYAVESTSIGPARSLLRAEGGQWTLFFTNDMDGFILVDPNKHNGQQKFSLKEAIQAGIARQTPEGYAVTVTGNTRAKIIIGDVVFLVHYVSLPTLALPLIALGGAAGASLLVLLISFGIAAAVHGAFGVLVAFTTDRLDPLTIDQLAGESAFAEALITPEEEEEEEPEEEEEEEEEAAPEEDEGARAAEEEGDVGKPDETALEGKFAIEGMDDNMELKKAYDTQVAQNSGLLASSQEMESLLGTGMTQAGFDSVNAWGEFDSTAAAGNTAGNYGLGMSGAGRGGGGTNTGGFGIGKFGTAGRGGGGGGGRNYGKSAASLGDKAVGKPKLKPGRPDVSGSLDKRIIRKVVNQHKREVKACYEKQLQKKKGLHGKIVVKWTIDQSGNVPSAAVVSSSMNDKSVESCLARSVKHWRFPAPKGGGLVIVSYPFVFEVGK